MSFIESATLRVIDQASKPIAQIDHALSRLMSKAQAVGSREYQIRIRAGDLSGVESKLSNIERMMRRAFATPNASIGTGLASQLAGVTSAANNATAAINRMNAAARAPANNGWFGRFPENIPGIAARYAGWNSVAGVHNAMRAGGRGIVDAASERTALNLTGVAVPDELIKGKSRAEAAAISQAYEAAVKAEIIKGAAATASKYRTLTDAGMIDVGRTAIPNMKDPAQIAKMMDTFGETAATLALVYKDAEKGMEGARQGYRALDQMGLAGDREKIEGYMKAWATGIFASGRDVSPIQMAQTISRLGGAKMGLSETALARLVMLQDEARGQTANLVRTFQNDMVRPDKSDKMLDRAIAAGVRDKKGNALYAAELQADPQMYILDRIKPIAEKFGYVTQKMDAATGKMVEMSDAEKAAQLNKILTDKMGFSSSAKTFVLDTLVKEDEILRNQRTILAQAAKLTPDALRGVVGSDIKSSLTAVQSQWKRAAESLTALAQPAVSGGLGIVSSVLDKIAASPSGAGFAAVTLGAAAAYAANNPHVVALGAAATAHLGAAAALTTAAARLAAGGLLTGATKGRALGFTPAPTTVGGLLKEGAAKWGNRLLIGAGVGAVGYDLLAGQMGNAALSAASLAASIYSPLLGLGSMIAIVLDQALNDGKITGTITSGIDKLFKEVFGIGQAKAETASKKATDTAAAELAKVDDQIAEKRLRAEVERNPSRRREIELEIEALQRQRGGDATRLGRDVARAQLLDRALASGKAMMDDPTVDRAIRARTPETRTAEALERTAMAAAQVASQIEGNSVLKATEAMERRKAEADARAGPTPDMGDWFPPPPPPSFWDRFWDFIIPKAAAADRPPIPDFIPYGGEPGLGLAGGVGGAGVGASLFDPLSAPLTTAGETAASSISAGGAEAGAAIGASGAEFVGAASSAGSVLLDYASQAGQALLSAASSVQFPVPSAASVPQRSQNTGANPVAR